MRQDMVNPQPYLQMNFAECSLENPGAMEPVQWNLLQGEPKPFAATTKGGPFANVAQEKKPSVKTAQATPKLRRALRPRVDWQESHVGPEEEDTG